MYGYIFETTNTKTGETYLGKRYAVSFDKNYFGEENNNALAVAIEKYGRPAFTAKMIMPYETQAAVDEAFAEMAKPVEKKVKAKKEPEVEVEPAQEPVVEEKKPAKRGRKKKTEEE